MAADDLGKLAAEAAVVIGSAVKATREKVKAAKARRVVDMPGASIGLLAGCWRCNHHLVATALQADDVAAEQA